MARISGVDLPREKRVEIGLTYIYGIGRASADRILAAAGVNPDTRVKDLTDDEVKNIAAVIALIVYFLLPAIAVMVSYILAKFLVRFLPGIWRVLSGGRKLEG